MDPRSQDFKTNLTINGIPPGKLADALEYLEREYVQWRDRLFLRSWRKAVLWFAREPIRIFRRQIQEACQAYQDVVIDQKAANAQTSLNEQYTKIAGDMREFQRFFREQFPNELADAQAREISLHQLAKEIMLKGRK